MTRPVASSKTRMELAGSCAFAAFTNRATLAKAPELSNRWPSKAVHGLEMRTDMGASLTIEYYYLGKIGVSIITRV